MNTVRHQQQHKHPKLQNSTLIDLSYFRISQIEVRRIVPGCLISGPSDLKTEMN